MLPTTDQIKIFAGSASRQLAHDICNILDVPVGSLNLERFADGEMFVEIGENVRGKDIFVIQSTASPANDNLMELLITVDALKRASARSICAVMPYYGYARQDRKVQPRTPITAKLVCDIVTAAGANRVLSVDLHAGQIQGFFDIPFDHLFAMPVLLEDMRRTFESDEVVIVSPDAGGVERARAYAKRLGCGLAIIDKRRPKPNLAEIMNIVGDVSGFHALLVDDMVDTAGTLTAASVALMEQGAKSVRAYATHAVLSGPAVERLDASPIEKLIITDTIELTDAAKRSNTVESRTIAPLLAKALRRIHIGESVSSLFV